MTDASASIYVFTKDNARFLAQLLCDLRIVDHFTPLPHVFIVDDSVRSSSRDEVSRIAGEHPRLQIEIIRRGEQLQLPTALAEAAGLHRPLGTIGYDIGTCRNLAFAHALLSSPRLGAPVLLLDADIRLSTAQVGDVTLSVDGVAVLKEMFETAAADPKRIVGAPLIGRADISALEHLDFASRTEGRVTVAYDCYQITPTFVDRRTPGFGQPLGMSGGAICVGADALRCAPMMTVYNEDILWLSYLREFGFTLVATVEPLIHADSTHLRIDSTMLRQQSFGEALWLVMDTCGWREIGRGQLSEQWEKAVHVLSNQLRDIARRIRQLPRADSDGLNDESAEFFNREADWTAAMPEDECSAALDSYRNDISEWQSNWMGR